MEEIWKDILGYEGLYQISNLGRIKRIARGPHTQIGRILRQCLRGRGNYKYLCVSLCKNRKQTMKQIHHIMLESFVRPFGENEIARHMDGDRFHNRLSNLEYGTQKMNINDRDRHGNTIRGSRQWKSKLDDEKVREIRSLYGDGKFNTPQLAKMFDVDVSTIGRVVNRDIWKHIT